MNDVEAERLLIRAEAAGYASVMFERAEAARQLRQALRACTLAMYSARLDGFSDPFWTSALQRAERLLAST